MTVKRVGPGTEKLAATLDGLDDIECRVGWFENAQYPTGEPVAYIATIQEFGAPSQGIPPRPFMRPAVEDNGPEWMKLIGQGAKLAVDGGISSRDVLDMVGARAAGDVAKKIQAVTSPKLKDATIAARSNKSTKPLIDSGQMFQSVTWRVGDAGAPE